MDLVMLRKRSQTAEKHCEDKKHAKDYGPDDDERGNRCESPFDHKMTIRPNGMSKSTTLIRCGAGDECSSMRC